MQKFAFALILLMSFTLTGKYVVAQFDEDDGVYVSLRPGISIDRMKPSGYLIDYLKFDNPAQPYLSALVDFDLQDEMDGPEGFILRLEAEYKPIHFYASGYANKGRFDTYELKATTFSPAVSLLYCVPLHWKIRPYGGIGIGSMIANTSKNTLKINYNNSNNSAPDAESKFDLDEENAEVLYSFGFMLGKRYDLNCKFWNYIWSRFGDDAHRLKNTSIILSFGWKL